MMRFSFPGLQSQAARRLLSLVLSSALASALGVGEARGSAALLLEMPYGDLGTFNPTGHAALYFDHICAATPLQLRPCQPGELGVVLSRYDGIGNYDWVAVPLIPYLYGVETAGEVPETMDKLSALRVRDLYRRAHLETVAPDTPEGGMPQGNWYELVGSAFDRDLYGFQMKTTPEQDAGLVEYFNDRPNVTRYQGAFRNCADFTRIILNRLYPGAVRRNYVADFGLTTPKSVARGLVHYGHQHPELGLTTFRVPQMQGTIPRSMSIQGVTGSLLTRYAVPLAILSPHLTAVVVVAYLGRGRFLVPKNAPVLDLAGSGRARANDRLQRASLPGSPVPGSWSLAGDVSGVGAGPQNSLAGQVEPSLFSGSAAPVSGMTCDTVCDAVPFLP